MQKQYTVANYGGQSTNLSNGGNGPTRDEVRAWAQRTFGLCPPTRGVTGANAPVEQPPSKIARERLPATKPLCVERVHLEPGALKRLGKRRRSKVAKVCLRKDLLWAPPKQFAAHDWHIACAIVLEARRALNVKLHEMSFAAGGAEIQKEKDTWRAYKIEKDYYMGTKPNFSDVIAKEGKNGYEFRRSQLLRDPSQLGRTVTVRTSIRNLLKIAGLQYDRGKRRNTKASIEALSKPLQVMKGNKAIDFESLVHGAIYDQRGVTLQVSVKWFSKPFGRVTRPLVRKSVVALRMQLLTTMFNDDNGDGIASQSLCNRLG